MLRASGAAMLGYIVMVACVLLFIAAAWFGLGSQFAFQGESTMASTGWSLVMLAGGFVAAGVGGLVAAKVAGPFASLGVNFLMGLIAALGIASLLMALNSPPPAPARRQDHPGPLVRRSGTVCGQPHLVQRGDYRSRIGRSRAGRQVLSPDGAAGRHPDTAARSVGPRTVCGPRRSLC